MIFVNEVCYFLIVDGFPSSDYVDVSIIFEFYKRIVWVNWNLAVYKIGETAIVRLRYTLWSEKDQSVYVLIGVLCVLYVPCEGLTSIVIVNGGVCECG